MKYHLDILRLGHLLEFPDQLSLLVLLLPKLALDEVELGLEATLGRLQPLCRQQKVFLADRVANLRGNVAHVAPEQPDGNLDEPLLVIVRLD